MKTKSIVPLCLLLVLISCSFLKKTQNPIVIKGSVTVTKYLIPTPSELSFYVENQLFQEVKTNVKGQFFFNVPKDYADKEGFAIINPIKNSARKDTLVKGTDISAVQAIDVLADTFYFDSFHAITDFQLKNYQLMEIIVKVSH